MQRTRTMKIKINSNIPISKTKIQINQLENQHEILLKKNRAIANIAIYNHRLHSSVEAHAKMLEY